MKFSLSQISLDIRTLLTKFRVATSDAVVKNADPAFGLGIFARTSAPLSIVIMNALLNWPSMHFSTFTPITTQALISFFSVAILK
jgi:hypothetical protein